MTVEQIVCELCGSKRHYLVQRADAKQTVLTATCSQCGRMVRRWEDFLKIR